MLNGANMNNSPEIAEQFLVLKQLVKEYDKAVLKNNPELAYEIAVDIQETADCLVDHTVDWLKSVSE